MAEALHGGVVGRVGHALGIVELGGEGVDQLVVGVVETRRFAIAQGFGDVAERAKLLRVLR